MRAENKPAVDHGETLFIWLRLSVFCMNRIKWYRKLQADSKKMLNYTTNVEIQYLAENSTKDEISSPKCFSGKLTDWRVG